MTQLLGRWDGFWGTSTKIWLLQKVEILKGVNLIIIFDNKYPP